MDNKSQPVTYAWIFARGGSKGLPGKNIKLLGGKPLIAHAIEVGLKSKYIDKVFVSTDDETIANVAKQFGAIVPFLRPKELAQDNSPEREAWQHAIRWMESQDVFPRMDVMVSLPTTSPLRTVQDVDLGIETFMKGKADTVISMVRSTKHPSFNMVEKNDDDCVRLIAIGKQLPSNRQATPIAYTMSTAFYVTSPDFVLKTNSFWQGSVYGVEIPQIRGIDIDNSFDFLLAELLLNGDLERT
jgi:N,N'-diacetyl-8-epilegionaminate cytidylyltransferase